MSVVPSAVGCGQGQDINLPEASSSAWKPGTVSEAHPPLRIFVSALSTVATALHVPQPHHVCTLSVEGQG